MLVNGAELRKDASEWSRVEEDASEWCRVEEKC